MRLRRSIRLSVKVLLTHKLRTTLALAGVGAGVAAVVLTSAIGTGAQQDIEQRIDAMGANLLVVRPAPVQRLVARTTVKGTVTTLRPDDSRAIAELPLVASAAPAIEAAMMVKAGNATTRTMVVGSTPAFRRVRRFEVRAGRFFDEDETLAARRVAVLGARVAGALFDADPVGDQIRIRGVPFEVVGVLSPKGVLADGDEDNEVLVPINTALRRIFNVPWLSTVLVNGKDSRSIVNAEAEIDEALRQRHRPTRDGQPDFEIQNASRVFALQQQATSSLRGLTVGLAAVALLVGGTGIMALLSLQVRARTGEIGLRVAVGARPRDILTQFLLEATLLAFGGWMGGIVLGAGGALVVTLSTRWHVAMPVQAVVASFVMAIGTGLGFGVAPARTASMIPPILALSRE